MGKLKGCLNKPKPGTAGKPGGKLGKFCKPAGKPVGKPDKDCIGFGLELACEGGGLLRGEVAGLPLGVVEVAIKGCDIVVTVVTLVTPLRETGLSKSGVGDAVGSFNNAARLLAISGGDACLFKWGSSLSFSVKPCN